MFSLIVKEKTADAIIGEMRKIKSFSGVSGSIEFTDDNKTLFPTAIFIVQDGTVKELERDETATTTKTAP